MQHRKLQAGHEEGISCHVRDTSEKCIFSSSALPTGAYICSRQYAQCSDTAFLYIFIVLILCLHRSLIPIASLYEAIQECYPRGLSAGGSNLSAEHRHRIWHCAEQIDVEYDIPTLNIDIEHGIVLRATTVRRRLTTYVDIWYDIVLRTKTHSNDIVLEALLYSL